MWNEESGIWNACANSKFCIPKFLIAVFHLCSVAELRDVLRRHALTGLETLRDFEKLADGIARRDDAFLDVIAGDDEHAAGAGACLHGAGGNEDGRRLRRLLDARRRKEARLQHAA